MKSERYSARGARGARDNARDNAKDKAREAIKRAAAAIGAIVIAAGMAVSMAACAESDPDAPNGYKRASNDTVDYYLYVPESWVIDTVEGSQLTSARVSEIDSSNISMMAFTDSDMEYATIEDYWEYYKASVQNVFDVTVNEYGESSTSFELINAATSEEEQDGDTYVMGGAAARKYVYTATLGGVELKYMQMIALREHTFYILTYTAHASSYDESTALGVVDNISFK